MSKLESLYAVVRHGTRHLASDDVARSYHGLGNIMLCDRLPRRNPVNPVQAFHGIDQTFRSLAHESHFHLFEQRLPGLWVFPTQQFGVRIVRSHDRANKQTAGLVHHE